jgi:hypothetical protein
MQSTTFRSSRQRSDDPVTLLRRLWLQAEVLYDTPHRRQWALLHHAALMRSHSRHHARQQLWAAVARLALEGSYA